MPWLPEFYLPDHWMPENWLPGDGPASGTDPERHPDPDLTVFVEI